MITLDHIAVSGTDLDAATAAVEAALGVPLQPGGRHDLFGTHNRLLGLEDGLYLEAIAIDPQAETPMRTRWFDLDRLDGPPRLSNWICRTGDLDTVLADLPGAGTPVALRRGALEWDMAVPADGRLPFDNLHPALIRWRTAQHPAATLVASGCRLRQLTVIHPEAVALRDALAAHLDDARVVFEPGDAPRLVASFDTPHGPRELA